MKQSKINFCWECGKKLRGNHYAELWIDGYPRVLHKGCAKDLLDIAKKVPNSMERLLKRFEEEVYPTYMSFKRPDGDGKDTSI